MIFLIHYDRPTGHMVSLRPFDNTDREKAETLRLNLELDLNRKGVYQEVVLLEAADEAALRRTHRRYFENTRQLTSSE
jgi:hypothetical protein